MVVAIEGGRHAVIEAGIPMENKATCGVNQYPYREVPQSDFHDRRRPRVYEVER